MFSNYKIVDKTLILYIDSLYEYGIDFSIKNNNYSMKDNIKRIIKELKFNGEKIVLVIGGIILATILVVENPKVKDDINLVYVKDNIFTKTNVSFKEEKEKETQEIKKEENKEDKGIVKEVTKQEIKNADKVQIEKTNEIESNITVYRSNGSIIELSMDDYLIGVVGAEMPASFDVEALKVQAIVSRTYALKSIEIGRKLTDTVSTQVYLGNDELKNKWGSDYDKYYNKIKDAVLSTKNIVIYYNNKLIDAVFYATTNGKSEDSKYVWGSEIPYLRSVDSIWDKDTTPYLKTVEKDLGTVLKILNVNTFDYEILSLDDSGRVYEIKVGDKTFSGVEFRNTLGLRSADFEIEINNDKVLFTTRGYGHGVGLSQYGSNQMAKLGYKYDEIIKHYYTGVEVGIY